MIESIIMELLLELKSQKMLKNIHPPVVTKTELFNEIRAAVNSLHSQGKLKIGDTINDKYIEILVPDKESGK